MSEKKPVKVIAPDALRRFQERARRDADAFVKNLNQQTREGSDSERNTVDEEKPK